MSTPANPAGYAANGHDIEVDLVSNHDHNEYAISRQVNTKAWRF